MCVLCAQLRARRRASANVQACCVGCTCFRFRGYWLPSSDSPTCARRYSALLVIECVVRSRFKKNALNREKFALLNSRSLCGVHVWQSGPKTWRRERLRVRVWSQFASSMQTWCGAGRAPRTDADREPAAETADEARPSPLPTRRLGGQVRCKDHRASYGWQCRTNRQTRCRPSSRVSGSDCSSK